MELAATISAVVIHILMVSENKSTVHVLGIEDQYSQCFDYFIIQLSFNQEVELAATISAVVIHILMVSEN